MKFSQNVHWCIRICCAKSLQQYSQYSFFDGILKTSRVPPLIAILESCLNLLRYSESHKSTIIADKLIKFAGHLAMVIVIKGCGKNLISEEQFFSSCILTTATDSTTPSGVC